MQDEGSAKKGLNPVLEKHWDKIVLAAVGVGFVIFLGGQFASGKNTPAKKVVGAETVFTTKKNAANPTFASPKPPPEIRIANPALAMKAPEWTHSMPTKYIPDIKEPTGTVAVGFFLPKLTLSAPQPTVKGVELRWSLSGEPDDKIKPAPIKVPPASFFYRIERRKKGEVKWQVLEPELKGNQRYMDRGTTPKTEYEYQVTLGSTDNQWIAKNPTKLSKNVGGPFATSTPGIWEFDFSNFTPAKPDEEPPVLATVYVKIVKHDPEVGRVEWSKIHQDKAPLGFENGDSKHTVFSAEKGRQVPVDFNLGGKILKIEVEKPELYIHKVCNSKINKDGFRECTGPEEKKEFHKVNVVTYTDEEGKQQEFKRETGSGKLADRLCADHGGAPPPKALDPAAIAAAKEKEVEKLLDEADRLWSSEEPAQQKKAQEKYMQLIKAHAESPAVKARRTDINDRVKKKIG